MFKKCNLKIKTFLILFLVGVILVSPFFNFKKDNVDFLKTEMSAEFVEAGFIPTSVIITVCGNGIVESGEQCDGSDLAGETCVSRGYDSGTLSCNNDCSFDISGCTSAPPPSGGGGGVTIPPPVPTKVIIKGKAYPLSLITVLQDGKLVITTNADSQANFIAEVTDLTPGVWTFGIWAEDKNGRKSSAFSFTVNISEGVITTLAGVFLPPTIGLEKTSLQKGETLNILGQSAPESEISIFVNSPGPEIIRKIEAETDGTWFYAFDTVVLEKGSHTVRAKAESLDELISTFSRTMAFSIGGEIGEVGFRNADINNNEQVNLVDFSILLYNWGIPKNPNADLNNDGKVNLVDFSIMLYWWTG